MVALAADKMRWSRNLMVRDNRYPVAADAVIYQGAPIMIASDGYANPAAVAASNKGCVGLAKQGVDNTGGLDGALRVEAVEAEFAFDLATLVVGEVGEVAYAEDDDTPIVTLPTSNAPRLGIVTEVDTVCSKAWILVCKEASLGTPAT